MKYENSQIPVKRYDVQVENFDISDRALREIITEPSNWYQRPFIIHLYPNE